MSTVASSTPSPGPVDASGPPPRKRARLNLSPPLGKNKSISSSSNNSRLSAAGHSDAAAAATPSESAAAYPTSTSTSTSSPSPNPTSTSTSTSTETETQASVRAPANPPSSDFVSPPSTPSPPACTREQEREREQEQEQVTSLSAFRLDMPDADVYHVPEFIPRDVARSWYEGLLGLDSWYQPKLKIYGREVVQSRKITAYTTSPTLTLKYSGQLVTLHQTYPPLLRSIQDQVEKTLGVRFNHVMLNLYEDGGVYIGRHRDNLENRVIASLSLGAPRTFVMTRDVKARAKADVRSGKGKKIGKGKGKRSKPASDSEKARENDSEQTVTNSKAQANETESMPGPTPAPVLPSLTGEVDKKTIVLEPGSLVVMQGETQKWWKHEIPKEPKIKEGRISLTFRQLEHAG